LTHEKTSKAIAKNRNPQFGAALNSKWAAHDAMNKQSKSKARKTAISCFIPGPPA
jgi:hypothetical protein